jgi:hypothetical protein
MRQVDMDRFHFDGRRVRLPVRVLAVCLLSSMLLPGCALLAALPRDSELVAPMPGPGCELVYHPLSRSGNLARNESTAA